MESRNETTSSNFGVNILGYVDFNYGTTTSTTTTRETPQLPAAVNPPSMIEGPAANSSSELIEFFNNKIPAKPSGVYIGTILKEWRNDYRKLDDFDKYIQWLFPNRAPGRNPRAPLITDEDARELQSSSYLEQKTMDAFRMMLSFFGMELHGSNKIDLARNHNERIRVYSHSKYYYIITRILLFLKEINKDYLMVAWLKVFADLIQKKKLNYEAKTSYNKYWIETLNQSDKTKIKQYIENLQE